MDVKEFIKETLTQIVEGINEANQQMGSKGAFVASSNLQENNGLPKGGTTYYEDSNNRRHVVREIDFDISVSVSDTSQTEGKGGLQVYSLFHANGGVENCNSSNSSHRIKFSIPLALPNM